MRYLKFPGLDLRLSLICLGTGSFGTNLPAADAFAVLDRFVELGGNFVDTAHVYGSWAEGGDGASERTIGEWLKSRGMGRRASANGHRFFIGTKGGNPRLHALSESRVKPQLIRQDLHESLERLGVDHVEFYWLHTDDPSVPVGELIDFLDEQKSAGLIGAYGCSNWTPARQQAALDWAQANHRQPFSASQVGWSLAEVDQAKRPYPTMLYMDREMYHWHRQSLMPVAAYSSQALGFFSGKYWPGMSTAEAPREAVLQMYCSPENYARLERSTELAKRHGTTANQVAIAWLLEHPFKTMALASARTVAQLEDFCHAPDLALSPELLEWLENG